MSKTYCALPWIHLGTHPHGGVTPCCISDHTGGRNRARDYGENGDVMFNLNDHDIAAHMNSDYFREVRQQMLNGEEPPACWRCYDEERKGLVSKRISEQANYPYATEEWARGRTRGDGKIDLDLRFVELRLGNTCNVRCRTCNPASSSQWLRDYKGLVESLDFVNDGYSWLDHKHDFKWPEDEAFYDDLYNTAPNMEVLYINGGEPTLIKAHWRYLERLVASGRSKNVILWYNVNMTILPEKAIDLWREFKEVRVCASIDDLETRNWFIRYPTDWDTVVKHMNYLLEHDFLNVRITQTVSAYNYPYLDEFFKWSPVPVDLNFVYDPDYLSPSVLPSEVRRDIHSRFRQTMGNDPQLGTCLSMYDNTNWDELKWEHYCRYNDQLDQQRGHEQGWREIFPEVIDLCEQHGYQHRF